MIRALALLGTLLAAAGARAAEPHAAGPRYLVINQKVSLDAGFGKVSGEHALRFPAPAPSKLAALRVGERITVPSAGILGTTQLSVEEGEHHWLRTYHPDPRKDRGATLSLTRTPAGIELSTALYLEDQPFTGTDPRDANEPQSLRGACRFVFDQGVSFLVATPDAAGYAPLHGSYHGEGEWSGARRCRGTVTAEIEVR